MIMQKLVINYDCNHNQPQPCWPVLATTATVFSWATGPHAAAETAT